MKKLLKLASLAIALLGASNTAKAQLSLEFWFEHPTSMTWELKARTNAPGGIASIVVELDDVASATSVAPRSTFGSFPVTGFTQGNIFSDNQAFAGQDISSAPSLVYGIGNVNVADAAFGAPVPFTMIGSAVRDLGGWVTFYKGNNVSPYSAGIAHAPTRVSGSVFANVGATTAIGPGPNLLVQDLTGYGASKYSWVDFNGDYNVDGQDFVIWQTHYPTATGATHSMGNTNPISDNDVDEADLARWQELFPHVRRIPASPVPNPPPGDFDADGDVDGKDFVAWQDNFPLMTGATRAKGDADADGDVDGADWQIWLANFPTQPAPGAPPVPEPQSAALAIVGLFGAGWIRGLTSKRWTKVRI